MKYTITNLSTLECIDCLHNSDRHLLDEVQEILEAQWDLVPDGRVKVWQTLEGIWVKEI